MKHMLLVFVLMSSVSARAIPFPDPVPGLMAALQFCTQIEDETVIPACVQIESSANWFTKEALPICRQQNFDEDRVRCLRGIHNSDIRVEEVQVCESLTFDDEKACCLAEIHRPFPYRTRLKVDPTPGLQAASRLCQSFFADDDKRRCLKELSAAELFTVESVGFCASRFSDDEKIQCLGLLRNKFIVADEVRICEKVFTDEGKLSCLQGVERKYLLRRP
ncbi:hypothetical protein EZJ49_01415 [Bdellovibrio bacteriovorus]|uniref:hypothetical protein n=1 Tax=Bdellovibrio bacteriovorus TaxID=959 RepID=UPI0021D175F3|nr:hypothetical protein [Bdellovibrio bacteriovorus]UXR64908.1 hypothetical protein EZJ49_01415 [Bdellovibrio bacteriovorus]